MLKTLLVASIAVNLVLGVYIVFMESLSWSVAQRAGVLTEDVSVGLFGGANEIFVLPKGLTVVDAGSANTMGQFEPYRFSIIVTADKPLVDYTLAGDNQFGNFYSVRVVASPVVPRNPDQ